MLKTKKEIAYAVGIILALTAILIVVVVGLHLRNKPADADAVSAPAPSETAAAAAGTGLVKEKHTISFETVQDGLRDMGFLVTEEYYFKEVVSPTKMKKLFGITLPLTESSYIGSYEGTVSAGVDFSAITVTELTVGETTKLTVTVPKPVLQDPVIDHDSFELYSEKTGIANPFSADEYNDALRELEADVQANALEKGILDRAGEHAEIMIENFVRSLLAGTDYTLEIVVK